MNVAVREVRISATQMYDVWGKVCIGAQIVVVFRESALGPDRFALSRLNYGVEDTPRMREYHKRAFMERAKKW